MADKPVGRVLVGFSHPTIGLYSAVGGDVKYTDGRRLARGVEVSFSINTSDDNKFYADNQVAESESGKFIDGKATLTVDGLHDDADRMISGIPAPVEVSCGDKKVKVTKYGDSAKPPYLGVGFLLLYQCGGADIWQPMILTKGKFATHGTDAKTQEEKRDWQTQKLDVALHRDDSATHDWKWLAEEFSSEAEALAVLDALLGVSAPAAAGAEEG